MVLFMDQDFLDLRIPWIFYSTNHGNHKIIQIMVQTE